MSNMNFNCDVCGREVQGCTFVNGMKFCAKCYQETFGETEKDRKIADLEAKLAEKDKEIEDLHKRLKNTIVPKFKKDEFVYAVFSQTDIFKGQIDAFDCYTNSYLIFPNEDIGNEWISAHLVFATKEEARKRLEELKGKVEDVKD